LIVSLGRPESDRRAWEINLGSVLSGAFGSLLCVGSAFVVPAFAKMFAEVGICLPTSTELIVGLPGWAWWGLSVLSIVLLTLKDRWLRRTSRRGLNGLYVALTVGAGSLILLSLFSACVCTFDRL